MKRGTAAKVILGKDTLMDVPAGIVHGTDVILGGKAGLLNDFGGLVLSNNLMIGKKVSRGTITTVTVRGQSPLVLPDAIAGSLQAVKAFGGTEQRNLPSGYTQLEYIESTGTQYINTGIAPNDGLTLKVVFAFTGSASSTRRVFGKVLGSSATALNYREVGTSFYWFGSISNSDIVPDSQKHTVEFRSDGKVYRDNAEIGTKSTFGTGVENPMYLFAELSDGYAVNYGQVKIYEWEVYNQGVLIQKFVPAKNSNNVIGMYDTVSGQFFTNGGTGDFAAGSEAVPTPDYPMDIVSNNGVLAFRDTELPTAYRRILGMTMNNDCYYEITGFKMNGSDTLRLSFTRTGANACNVLGAYDGTSAQSNYSLYAGAASNASYLRYNGGTYNSYAIADKKYDVVITPTGSDGMETDSTWDAKTFTSTGNLCIGTTSPSATSYKMVGSIHGSVVVDGRLELIPCERVSDGEIGYYDTYTETFFEPIGTTPTSLGYDYTKCDIVAAGPVETINVHTKNLFDKSAATRGFYIATNGSIFASANWSVSDYIPVVAGQIITISGITYISNAARFNFYNSNKEIIDVVSYGNVTLTPPANASYIQICYRWVDDEDTVQLELGSTATDYVPYFDGGTATAEMLLKVGNYQDVQSIIDGVVTRKVGVVVLTGTETMALRQTQNNIATYHWSAANGCPTYYGATDVAHLCSHLPYKGTVTGGSFTAGQPVGLYVYWFEDSPTIKAWYFNVDATVFPTLQDWTDYLAAQYAAGTPVIVVYPLNEPTTESVAGQTLQVTDGDNVLEITHASLTGLELEATYKSLVQLTIQEVEDANLNNNVEVTIS